MDFVIVGTYDHTAYYETRLLLAVLSLGISLYLLATRKDSRHLVVFLSSGLLMGLMEYVLQAQGLRGAGYSFSLFSHPLAASAAPLLQGLLEGGVCGLMALWFADLRSTRAPLREWRNWIVMAVLVLLLSIVTGIKASPQEVTSVQPIFSPTPILIITTIIFFSLLIAWRKDAIAPLANFYAGLLIFAVLNFEPLHLLGARYVGVVTELGATRAGSPWQVLMRVLSYVYDAAGGKIHYLMIPLACGLLTIRERSTDESERLSYQHLQHLANRGWRRKSNPFKRYTE
ncbi:MAG: hypothetical protein ACK5RS_15405 [Acidobacteriota bacterium]